MCTTNGYVIVQSNNITINYMTLKRKILKSMLLHLLIIGQCQICLHMPGDGGFTFFNVVKEANNKKAID